MSFLNQLKSQANALQNQQGLQRRDLEESIARTEAACRFALDYLGDLARQLNVIQPAAPRFSLDGRTPWPAMKLAEFRVDSRKKLILAREAFEYVAMGWRVVPQVGQPVEGRVRVNFPPDLQRVESRLMMGPVKHERREIRHPEKNTLQAIEFEYITETRGSVHITADHDRGALGFRILNASGFDVLERRFPAVRVAAELMDELAKLVVGQPNRFG
ncbi:hypothetical protein [Ramlibacter sp.]|uniref:hypothetical protein n=1 Tax=Ramlibacter sp. TaxID=1917967 RepID=UPI002C5AEF8C|nr:hypothetical protein [Ramlibacter sp.]HWI84572.1 hypothetical protein [Ramlibacter sp.]